MSNIEGKADPFQAVHDNGSLNVINAFNIWDAVPLKGSATYAEISTKVGLPESLCRRILRYNFTRRIFKECTLNGNAVKHTMLSAAVVHTPSLRSWLSHLLEETNPAAANWVESLKYYNGNITDPDKSSAAYTFFRDRPDIKSFWGWCSLPQEHWRAERFGNAMKWTSQDPRVMRDILHGRFDWKSLGAFTFVDVGGSAGHISFEMAKKYPELKAIVQDLPEMTGPFNAALPEELKDRVIFEEHDFFTPQARPADIFFLKFILHDWSDPYAIEILKNIVPAMTKPNSRIMLMDFVLPPLNTTPLPVARMIYGADMQMGSIFNSKERSVEDWTKLVKEADEKLEIMNVHVQQGAPFVIMEIKYHIE